MWRSDMEKMAHSRSVWNSPSKKSQNHRSLSAAPEPLVGSLSARQIARENFRDPSQIHGTFGAQVAGVIAAPAAAATG